jgi:4a-hydroxytetrahydrobiopterin dehydratase
MSASMLPKKDWSLLPRRALTPTEVVTRLGAAPGWQLTGSGADVAIEKTFTFANYHETIAFVNAVAFIAHKQDHHPELSVLYSR